MFVFSNLIHSVAYILGILLDMLFWAVIIRVLLSWANADPANGLVRAVMAVTEPILKPFRRLLPPYRVGGWDLSPLFAIVAIKFLQSFLIPTLHQLGDRWV